MADISMSSPEFDPSHESELCRRCETIHLGTIIKDETETSAGILVVDLKASVQELKQSKCPLCRLFGDVEDSGSCIPARYSESCIAQSLIAFCESQRIVATFNPSLPKMHDIRNPQRSHDTVFLGIVREAVQGEMNLGTAYYFTCPMNASLQIKDFMCSANGIWNHPFLTERRISRDFFDTEFAIECVRYCRMNHNADCNVTPMKPMHSLRLIDCQTQSIINAAENCCYAALSYVWGASESSSSASIAGCEDRTGLRTAPKVVLDSMDVTLKLGLKYLWVDSLCINQWDDKDKQNQIRQMDLIYANAEITIIAAAGEGSADGLRGVRGTLRYRRAELGLDKNSVPLMLPRLGVSVHKSKLATRGWTYQEGLLSKRRLIFTDEQVFYDCNQMHSAESLPQVYLGHTMEAEPDDWVNPLSSKTPGENRRNIMYFLAEYNSRELTFPKDAVNAAQGIFNSFEHRGHSLHHFIGVPILPLLRESNYAERGTPKDYFLVGLCWHHLRPARRRPGFPSWSWAGWHGQLAARFLLSRPQFVKLDDISLWVENDNGELTRFPKEMEALADFLLSRIHCKNRYIRITANVLQLELVYLYQPDVRVPAKPKDALSIEGYAGGTGYYAKIQLDKTRYIYLIVRLDLEPLRVDNLVPHSNHLTPTMKGLIGILIGQRHGPADSAVLVVEDNGQHAERVGSIRITKFASYISEQGLWSVAPANTQFDCYRRLERRTIRLG